MIEWKYKMCNMGNGKKQRKTNTSSTLQVMHYMICNSLGSIFSYIFFSNKR